MRKEFIGSVLVHGGLVIGALVFMGLPKQDDAPAMGSVTVDIISASLVTSNQTESIESDAAETLVVSGAQASLSAEGTAPNIEPLVPQTVVQQSESIEPVAAATVESATTTAIEPAELAEPAESDAISSETIILAALNSESVEPENALPVLEPVETSEKPRRVEPVMPVPRPADLTVSRPAPNPARPTPAVTQPPAAQQAGDGGASAQSAAAARSSGGEAGQGSGGSADEARYPGQVERKVARALRYPSDARGARGEVLVNFTIDASGSLLTLSLGRSSGDVILDQAALTTVQRAAPFPAFPNGSARASWDFSVPLSFSRN